MNHLEYYLLDTNVLVAYIRAGPLGKYIERAYQLMEAPFKPLICVVSVGEVFALSLKFQWGASKRDTLDNLLNELVWIDVNTPEVLRAYAEISHYSESIGRTKPQNDYWIAAAAKAAGATLLTTDKDFDDLADVQIKRAWIDERNARRP
jgi:predicted nucleic acid-binding protein